MSALFFFHNSAEHVFEAQVIADFFTQWLDKGWIVRQSPDAVSPEQKFSCSQIDQFILNGLNWHLPNLGNVPFIHYVMGELGSVENQDRLTVYQARPNMKKGAVCLWPSPSFFK